MSLQWLIQICDAVAAVHSAGVIHGDLTPNNVLLSRNGHIAITDFGLAANVDRLGEASESSRSVQTSGGPLGFAAPEQISPAFGQVGPATDIYAIGGLAFFLLTGRAPHGRSHDSLVDTVTDDDVVLPDSFSTAA